MRVVDPRFAQTLRRLRAERDMSLRDLARASFIGKSTVSELENGRMRPSADIAATSTTSSRLAASWPRW